VQLDFGIVARDARRLRNLIVTQTAEFAEDENVPMAFRECSISARMQPAISLTAKSRSGEALLLSEGASASVSGSRSAAFASRAKRPRSQSDATCARAND
jgi:hypothetical protein